MEIIKEEKRERVRGQKERGQKERGQQPSRGHVRGPASFRGNPAPAAAGRGRGSNSALFRSAQHTPPRREPRCAECDRLFPTQQRLDEHVETTHMRRHPQTFMPPRQGQPRPTGMFGRGMPIPVPPPAPGLNLPTVRREQPAQAPAKPRSPSEIPQLTQKKKRKT